MGDESMVMDEQVIDGGKRRLKTKRPADGDFDSA
jgi:hypothetical protein